MIYPNSLLLNLERLAVAFLLFSAAGVTIFSRSSLSWENLLMPILFGVLGLVLSYIYRLGISRSLLIFMCGYLFLFLCQWLWYGSFHPKHLILYPLNIWVAYCFVRSMGKRLFFHLEIFIVWLAAFSLAVWSIDILSGGALRSALSGIVIGHPYADIIDSHLIVYTFINDDAISVLPRNSGFAWEPGAFAVFCCVGIIFNMYRTGFRLKRNLSVAVLVTALLSSQSTTGYSILLVIILFMMWRKMGIASRSFMPFLAFALTIGVASLPFMQDKIYTLWNEDLAEVARSATSSWNSDKPIAAQRFLSFDIDFSDFLNNPWTGYGGRNSESIVEREALNIVSISGIGKVMAKFGLLGIAFFLWSTVSSSVLLSHRFGAGMPLLLAAFILMVSVSYSLIEHPLFIAIWAYWFLTCSGIDASNRAFPTLRRSDVYE